MLGCATDIRTHKSAFVHLSAENGRQDTHPPCYRSPDFIFGVPALSMVEVQVPVHSEFFEGLSME
jgi:hypothetical protein